MRKSPPKPRPTISVNQPGFLMGSTSHVRELSGGVSNIVLRVDVRGQPPFVIKQCRERCASRWTGTPRSIGSGPNAPHCNYSAHSCPMVQSRRFCSRIVPNYLFAMTCARRRGHVEDAPDRRPHRPEHRRAARHSSGLDPCGRTRHPALRESLADTSLFEELRIDPYYRTAAAAHPELARASTT